MKISTKPKIDELATDLGINLKQTIAKILLRKHIFTDHSKIIFKSFCATLGPIGMFHGKIHDLKLRKQLELTPTA